MENHILLQLNVRIASLLLSVVTSVFRRDLPSKGGTKPMENNLTQQVIKSEKVEVEQVSNSEPLRRLIASAPSLLKNLAPDILEVAIASLVNPIAGIGLLTKRIADHQKITEAKVHQAAEEQFREKAIVYKEAYQNLIESDNLHRTALSLA